MANWLQLIYEGKDSSERVAIDKDDESEEKPAVMVDNWLQECSPMLADIPEEVLSPNIIKKAHIQLPTESVKFAQIDGDFFVKKQGELIRVLTGDVIETEGYLLKIQINKEIKPRQSDSSIFGINKESLSLDEPKNEIEKGSYSYESKPNHMIPRMENKQATMNPLEFLGESARQPVDHWSSASLLLGMDGILDSTCDESPSMARQADCLQTSFEGSVYKNPVEDVVVKQRNSVIPFNSSHYASERTNNMVYEDMQKKKSNFIGENERPLDEIDQAISETYDVAVGQNSYVDHIDPKQMGNLYNSDRLVNERLGEESFIRKIKRRLWD